MVSRFGDEFSNVNSDADSHYTSVAKATRGGIVNGGEGDSERGAPAEQLLLPEITGRPLFPGHIPQL